MVEIYEFNEFIVEVSRSFQWPFAGKMERFACLKYYSLIELLFQSLKCALTCFDAVIR